MDKTDTLVHFSIHPDLQKERSRASFDRESLTVLLDGGREYTQKRRRIEAEVLSDDILSQGSEYPFLSTSETYDLALKKLARYIEKYRELDAGNDKFAERVLRQTSFPSELPPMNLHIGMFLTTLEYQATEEQNKKWLLPGKNYEIIGTYAQTEMGHGTHLRGIETTAEYDKHKEEFVLNSPNLTSVKWWPGGLGKTCNYALVMATLLIDGKNCGMQPFILQIRDMDTHEPLPGISVGVIGPKLGMHSTDNGYLKIDNVRIPRDHMLMKNAVVKADGTFVKPKNQKMTYGTMIFVRAGIVKQAYTYLASATTIATRYSCIRRQSELEPGKGEPQVLDYQTQRYKIFPAIAASYAFCFASQKIADIYLHQNAEIQQGNMALLPELHALTAGLKAFTTNVAMWGIEQCRLSCGGHGYSQASGIPKIYGRATPACTYEGENTVLLLQTGRFLMKVCQQVCQGQKLQGSVAYLNERISGKQHLGSNAKQDQLELNALVKAFQNRARHVILSTFRRYDEGLAKGRKDWELRNLLGVELVRAANAHCQSWVVENFVDKIQTCEANKVTKNVLSLLCKLYGVYGILENTTDFLEDNYFTPSDMASFRNQLFDLLDAIRPEAVVLVDAFDFPDHLLGSVLGRHDGKVYENLYNWAQRSPLNATEVHPSFHKYLKPLRQELAKSKL